MRLLWRIGLTTNLEEDKFSLVRDCTGAKCKFNQHEVPTLIRNHKLLSLVYATILGVFSLGLQVEAQTSTPHIKLDNFGRISDTYYRGSQPEGQDYADLAAFGIKTVINLTSDDAQKDEQTMVEKEGRFNKQIPMTTHRIPSVAELSQFLSIVNDPAKQPVYVHCVGGKHRTGVMTAVYRMTQNGWTADQAFKEMKQFKFGADFLHSEFKQFVF